jgi:hypothetical protein
MDDLKSARKHLTHALRIDKALAKVGKQLENGEKACSKEESCEKDSRQEENNRSQGVEKEKGVEEELATGRRLSSWRGKGVELISHTCLNDSSWLLAAPNFSGFQAL